MSGDVEECSNLLQIDEIYEFSSPRYFDFVTGETEDEIRQAQKWFEVSHKYAPLPFILRIKTSRSVEIESDCNLQEAEEFHLAEAGTEIIVSNLLKDPSGVPEQRMAESKMPTDDHHEETDQEDNASEYASVRPSGNIQKLDSSLIEKSAIKTTINVAEACAVTPKAQIVSSKSVQAEHSCNNTTKAKTLPQKSSTATKLVKETSMSRAKATKGSALRVPTSAAKKYANIDIRQENQAIKRQKLEGGRSRQILNVKERILHHKSQVAVVNEKPTNPQTKSCRDKRYELTTRKEINPNPFVSAALLVKRFQSSTRELDISQNRSLSHDDASLTTHRKPTLTLTQPKEPEFQTARRVRQVKVKSSAELEEENRKPTLTLTQPKEPEFQTARRVRQVKVKSSAELEEEMLANIPKFKARPLIKKILEGPTLPPLPRSIPQSTQFHEFHLQTMERASQHVGSSSIETSQKEKPKSEHSTPYGLTVPKSPHLETSSRARPPNVKSSQELEREELANIPKFKARPLNKKIFKSKGELGVLLNQKHQITIPQEFHFATDDRIPPIQPVVDLFDKLSICSENREKQLLRVTVPDPFHLETEERGLEKEKRLAEEILHQQLEEQKARIPKASPYPYSTDYPVIPPKPQPKECTKPEGFQLVSLIRHEEEMQKIMEEMERAEKEAANMRIFKAQPIMTSYPIPVPERPRKPLTEVQDFVLHVEHRAVEREEFDKKVKEKEAMFKRYREEYEAAKMEEEEKAMKQMRRMMVPHARPLPNFANPFLPQRSSKELTRPKSPCLLVAQRKLRAKPCVAAIASTQMR